MKGYVKAAVLVVGSLMLLWIAALIFIPAPEQSSNTPKPDKFAYEVVERTQTDTAEGPRDTVVVETSAKPTDANMREIGEGVMDTDCDPGQTEPIWLFVGDESAFLHCDREEVVL